MFQSAAFDVYSCSHKTIHPGQMEKFSLGFKMKMPKGYCAKIYGRSGMTVKHGIHLAGGVSIIDPDFRGPISICLKNSHQSCPYKIKVNDRIAQMMIERVDEFEWIEGTEDDFKIEEASENASEGQCGRKRIRNLEALEVQEFEHEQKKMNKLLSQITFTCNKEKEKINYLNYSPPTTDESSSDMSCKFIFCLMLVLVRILCSVIICFSTCIFLIICIFVVEELVFLMASEKCCKKPKLMISKNF